MFNYIQGKISEINPSFITIDNHGLGYIIKTPSPYSFNLNEEVKVYTHVYIREDTFDIYGFKTKEERDFFIKLISVSGIGPKTALAIIAHGNYKEFEQAIKDSNIKYLQSYPGIGTKSSSQIVLDLRGKLAESEASSKDPKVDDVKDALKSLGFSSKELKKLDQFILTNITLPINELVKMCLTHLL